jgi:hypothetical protein
MLSAVCTITAYAGWLFALRDINVCGDAMQNAPPYKRILIRIVDTGYDPSPTGWRRRNQIAVVFGPMSLRKRRSSRRTQGRRGAAVDESAANSR